jgi:hypothetical protein
MKSHVSGKLRYFAPVRFLLLFVFIQAAVTVDLRAMRDPRDSGIRQGVIKRSMFLRRNFSVVNGWARIKITGMRWVCRKRLMRGRAVRLSGQYDTVWVDQFDSLDRSKWRIGLPWGRIHPGHPHQWYSDEAVYCDSGVLHLSGFYAPQTLNVDGKDTMVPFQVGLISSDPGFSIRYGFFEISSQNPTGPAVWPAFWLTPVWGWPPEIDIFEMYGRTGKGSLHRTSMSLHYGTIEGRTKSQYIRFLRLPANTNRRFYRYACLWEEKRIRFYFNGFLIGQIRLNAHLRRYFASDMYVVLNNSFHDKYLHLLQKDGKSTDFRIEWLRVMQRRVM